MLTVDFVSKFPLFQGIKPEKMKSLIAIMAEIEFKTGDWIIRDGDRGEEMFVLLDGDVEISKSMTLKVDPQASAEKNKSLFRLSSKAFACFGEMALIEENSERSASVRAVVNCKVATIRRDQFLQLADKDPEIGNVVFRNMARIISDRLKKANKDILKLTTAFLLAVDS